MPLKRRRRGGRRRRQRPQRSPAVGGRSPALVSRRPRRSRARAGDSDNNPKKRVARVFRLVRRAHQMRRPDDNESAATAVGRARAAFARIES